jgi:hypothetical protein
VRKKRKMRNRLFLIRIKNKKWNGKKKKKRWKKKMKKRKKRVNKNM